jgi:hypothetical protein
LGAFFCELVPPFFWPSRPIFLGLEKNKSDGMKSPFFERRRAAGIRLIGGLPCHDRPSGPPARESTESRLFRPRRPGYHAIVFLFMRFSLSLFPSWRRLNNDGRPGRLQLKNESIPTLN